MKNRSNTLFARTLALVLLLLICVSALSACKSNALTPSKQALTEVGTVDGKPVYYEELYFLATTYDSDELSADELWEKINENIVTNYAILKLCEQSGVEYDEKQLKKDVQSYIDDMIEDSFGSRSNYLEALKESGMTDHYVRTVARCDLLYSQLATTLARDGKLLAAEEDVIAYVKENFVRTWHLMIANNKGDDVERNRANAEAALADLKAGKTTMYKLIGGALNEDILIPYTGYTFGKGYMEKAYEDAALALEVGGFSEVITAKAELASGEIAECFYVIERLELTEDFIKENYDDIYDKYVDTAVVDMLEQTEATLTFVPNEYAKSLDIKELEPIGAGSDTITIVTVCVIVAVVGATALTIVLVIRKMKKNSAERLAIKRQALAASQKK